MEEEGGVLITVVVVAVVLMAELLEVCVLLGIAKERTRTTKYNWFVFVFSFVNRQEESEYSFLLDISFRDITSN